MLLNTDTDRRAFLDALDNSDKVEVTDWEAKFLSDTMGRTFFTISQQNVIARMHRMYDHRM